MRFYNKVFLGFLSLWLLFSLSMGLVLNMNTKIREDLKLNTDLLIPLTRVLDRLDRLFDVTTRNLSRLSEFQNRKIARNLTKLVVQDFERELGRIEKKLSRLSGGVIKKIEDPKFNKAFNSEYDRIETMISRYEERLMTLEEVVEEKEQTGPDLDSISRSIGMGIDNMRRSILTYMDSTSLRISVVVENTLELIALFALFAFGISLWVLFEFSKRMKRIEMLSSFSEEVGKGNFDIRLPEVEGDEVGILVRSFSRMVDSLKRREEELNRRAKELLRQERLAAFGTLSSKIVHEIRNPLNSMGLNLEFLVQKLRSKGEEMGELVTVADDVYREIERLTAVTEEYLQFSRIPRPQPEELRLKEFLDQLLRQIKQEADEKGVKISLHMEQDSVIRCDPGHLKQTLLNLVRNAIEATKRDGSVVITCQMVEGDRMAIDVSDDGPGVPEEIQKHLFEPFYSTKKGGTGLGLSLAKELMDMNGGELKLVRTGKSGSTFRILLPLSSRESQDRLNDKP